MTVSRTALVVGASRGLGLGLAAELKSRGWNVVATVRGEAGERRLRALAEKPGGEIRVEESVRGIVDMLEARAGTFRHGFVDYRGREVAW